MKKIIISLSIIVLVAAVVSAYTVAYFSDTETSVGNTFAAGTLDLEVNGTTGFVPFAVNDLKPGDSKGSPTYAIKNNGSMAGVLSFKVKNITTNENGVLEPELEADDAENVRLDPDGFTVATGFGELLDQVYLTFWVDDNPGQRPSPSDWQDTKFWTGYPDESSYYSITPDTNLMSGKNIVLQPGQVLYMGVGAQFINDTSTSYSWILDGVKNNAAMGDDFKFDIELGLTQVQ